MTELTFTKQFLGDIRHPADIHDRLISQIQRDGFRTFLADSKIALDIRQSQVSRQTLIESYKNS